MVDIHVPGAWPVWTPWSWLAGFIKRTTILYIATHKISKLWPCGFKEEDFFMFLTL